MVQWQQFSWTCPECGERQWTEEESELQDEIAYHKDNC